MSRRGPRGAVLVTGSTGNVGRAVARHLVLAGETVISGVRADTADPTAGSGVDRMFLLRPPQISDVARYLFPLIDSALDAGVRKIVFLSLQGVQFNTKTPHHAVEKYLRARSAPFTFLRPNFFMQNLSTSYRDDIRDRGEIFVPAVRGRTAFVDTDDLGAVAAVVLTRPGHLRKAYTLSGEQSHDYYGVARQLTAALGYEVRYAAPSAQEYVARLTGQGAPADYIEVQKMIYRVVRANVSALPNRSIRRLTGRPATTFAQFAEREKAVWART
ncbi:uncharacterized protein YbjT (DUF2867 family) [Marisediminicola sp. UYEF4]|uniref:NmrA family NAD(P)-binding protein n=1 Tax=Marisediminicola sp. UYEF4 TaxID=1756384 RepID=UPI00339910D8